MRTTKNARNTFTAGWVTSPTNKQKSLPIEEEKEVEETKHVEKLKSSLKVSLLDKLRIGQKTAMSETQTEKTPTTVKKKIMSKGLSMMDESRYSPMKRTLNKAELESLKI